jgi:hypothetical protein
MLHDRQEESLFSILPAQAGWIIPEQLLERRRKMGEVLKAHLNVSI